MYNNSNNIIPSFLICYYEPVTSQDLIDTDDVSSPSPAEDIAEMDRHTNNYVSDRHYAGSGVSTPVLDSTDADLMQQQPSSEHSQQSQHLDNQEQGQRLAQQPVQQRSDDETSKEQQVRQHFQQPTEQEQQSVRHNQGQLQSPQQLQHPLEDISQEPVNIFVNFF